MQEKEMPEKLKKRFIESIRQRTWGAIKNKNLIQPGDRIIVGVSGGKDSLVLLETLALGLKYFNFDYKLYAVHININNVDYETQEDYFNRFCENLGVEAIYKTIEIDFDENHKKGPCFICSWHRRKTLFQLTEELGCNKLALGHNVDDAVETMLMNLIYHGSISSIPNSLSMFQGRIELIRPLLDIEEENILKYSQLRGFITQKKECPYGENTSRNEMKELIKSMEKLNKPAKINLYNGMKNIFEEYLPR